MDGFDLVFSSQTADPKAPDSFNLSFYALSDEAVFRASFEDASGRDPLPTALLERLDARKLVGHIVKVYESPPGFFRADLYVASLDDYALTTPGRMIWLKSDLNPIVKMGRWAQLQGRTFGPDPLKIEIVARVSDHAESFIEPTL